MFRAGRGTFRHLLVFNRTRRGVTGMRDFVARPEHGVVWISGASSGIGRALTLKLAGECDYGGVTAREHKNLLELQTEAHALSGSIIVRACAVRNACAMEHPVAAIEYQHGNLSLAV